MTGSLIDNCTCLTDCVLPESIHISPQGRSLEIARRGGGGGGALKAKLLEERYEAKLKFPGGEGVQNKTPSVGECGFLNYILTDCL